MTKSTNSKNNNIKKTMKETMERRKSQVCAVYKVKIDESHLSKKQSEQLKLLFVESKWLYNDILNWSENSNLYSYDTKVKQIKVLNKDNIYETRDLKVIGSQMKQAILTNIISAIKTLSTLKKKGHKVGRLKYISEYTSINLKQFGTTYQILNNKHMKVQNISNKIRVNGLDQFINIPNIEYANAKILNTPTGYYIAITTYRYIDDLPIKEFIGEEIGIDMGIKDSITLSNGEKFKSFIEETEHLKRLQKKLFRQQKGSNNRRKTILKIRKEYQKIYNKKNDTANKVVSHILSYKNVYMQDELISNWHKGLFGKQVQHSILGRVKSKLINHPRVYVITSKAPTTKFCPNCYNINKNITLKDRIFVCPSCGYTEDRDIHSAKNMITMIKLSMSNKIPRESRKFKPVETNTTISKTSETSIVYEAGSSSL